MERTYNMARDKRRKVRHRGRRKKTGFASWSIGKKIGAILGGTFLTVAVFACAAVVVVERIMGFLM